MLLVSSCKRMSAQEVGVNKVVQFSVVLRPPQVNMVLNVHRNRTAYWRREGSMEVGREGDYIPIATLSPPE